VITNNIFFGGGTITTQANALQQTNFAQGDPKLVDRAAYDYHLAFGSPCINAGSDPGTGAGFSLLPVRQYVHPASAVDRTTEGTIDIGAYEFGMPMDGGTDASDAGAPRTPDASDASKPPPLDASVDRVSEPPDASADASLPPPDAPDAGSAQPPGGSGGSSGGGCGCRTARGSTPGAALACVALVLSASGRRARRPRPLRAGRPIGRPR
jgi:hypothetical protein